MTYRFGDNLLNDACAKAMGITVLEPAGAAFLRVSDDGTGRCAYLYNPLTNDMQAMALVKKFRLHINADGGRWWACMPNGEHGCAADDLNRAIVECVAAHKGRR